MMIVHAECCRGVADDVDAHLIVGEWVGWLELGLLSCCGSSGAE
jgi:hypothetical protein